MREKFIKAKNKIIELNFKSSMEKHRDQVVKAAKIKEQNYNGLGLDKQKTRDPLSYQTTPRI